MKLNKIIRNLIILASLLVLTVSSVFSQGCVETSSSDEGVKVFGYIQPQWVYYQTANGRDANSFTFDRARLGVTGNIPYDVSYYVMVDFSRFKSGAGFVLDAFASYTRYDWFKVSMGQFKSPLSLSRIPLARDYIQFIVRKWLMNLQVLSVIWVLCYLAEPKNQNSIITWL
jgi:hypothetical protein